MVLESTMICVDNSDYMRNGDFLPTRLQAQQDAVNLVCHSKTRSNPENNVGLLTLANESTIASESTIARDSNDSPAFVIEQDFQESADWVEVLATLTSDVGRILSKLHQVQPNGDINLHTGIRIAHLALKHRQGKNHKMRIVAFVGSPVISEEKELVKLAKKLKKEKVNVDIVSFGEDDDNSDVLTTFISTINGKDGTSSHLVTVPPGPHLSDALISSPVIQGEDGAGAAGLGGSYEFGVDPNEDPELALALRVSMEEQRQRQEDEARRAREAAGEVDSTAKTETIKEEPSDEAMLEKALAMSMEEGVSTTTTPAATTTTRMPVDFANMTEDEQIAFAMQMSMQDAQESNPIKEEPMEVENDDDEDYSAVMNDPTFLQSVLESLPGVDPQSEAVRQAVGNLKEKKKDEKPDDKQKK